MRAFIVTETTLLLLGVGWAIDLLANPQALLLLRVVALGVCLLLGVLLGFLLARTAPKHIVGLSGMVWLWLYALLSGWVGGGAVFLLKVSEGAHVWPFVGVAFAFGTLPGCAIGVWLLLHNPMRLRSMAPIPINTVTQMPVEALGVPLTLIAARNALYAEVIKIQKATPDAQCELREVNASQLAVLYQTQTYFGVLSIYIVCDEDYPQAAPVDVFIEIASEGSAPVAIDYDRHLLDRWVAGTPRSSIEALIKDGILQVEESRIG